MTRKATIDYSSFRDQDGHEIIKELTVVDIDTKCEQHWIFKGPDSFDPWGGPSSVVRYNSWLCKHFHGLDFQQGYSDHGSILSALESVCTPVQLLFAESMDKAKTLEKLFMFKRVVFSLESLGCPQMPSTLPSPGETRQSDLGYDTVDAAVGEEEEEVELVNKSCLYHSLQAPWFVCTRTKAHYLADWCAEHPDLIDMNTASVRAKTFLKWKVQCPSAKDLAEGGFVRSSSLKDNVKCMYCGLCLHDWKEGDDHEQDHYENSPYCKFQRYQMQLLCEEQEKAVPRKAYFKNKVTCEEREAFRMRYGQVGALTWKEVKDMCSA